MRQGTEQAGLYSASVIEGWNLMGGTIDWSALPAVMELVHVEDAELYVRGLVQLRDHLREEAEAGRG